MMGGRFQRFDINRWRGLNEDENPSTLKAGELSISENVWRHGNLLGTRPGTQVEGSGLDWGTKPASPDGFLTGADANQPCHGLVDVSADFDGTRYLVAMFNGNGYWDNDAAVGNNPLDKATNGVQITAGADNLWTFAMHKDTLFAAGGKSSAVVDDLWYWDLVPANPLSVLTFEETGGGGQIHAEYIFEKWNRIWLNGMRGSHAANNPMVGRYSALNDGTTLPPGNTIGGSSAVGGFSAYGDEFSTGWGSYHDNRGDFLLFLTNKNIYSIVQGPNPYSPFSINDVIPTGCSTQRAFVDLGIDAGDAVYLSDKGIHSLRQSQIYGPRSDRFLSWKIRNVFKTVNKTRLKYATGAYMEDHGVVVFAVPTGSNSYNDLILALDVRDANTESGLTWENAIWYVWRLRSDANNAHHPQVLISGRDRSDDEPYVYGGNRRGGVFRFTTDIYSDLGQPYPTHFRTRHNDYDSPGITKSVGNTEIWVVPADDYSIMFNYVFDNGQRTSNPRSIPLVVEGLTLPFTLPGTLGSETNLQRKVIYGTGHGETIAYDFQHSSANQPFWVARVVQQVAGLGDDIGDV